MNDLSLFKFGIRFHDTAAMYVHKMLIEKVGHLRSAISSMLPPLLMNIGSCDFPSVVESLR